MALGVLAPLLLLPRLLAPLLPAGPPPDARAAPPLFCPEGAHRDASRELRCGPPPLGAGEHLGAAELLLLGTPLDVNTVEAAELELIPGVGPRLAARIVADRATRGPFSSIAELDRVAGVGPGLVAEIGALAVARPNAAAR